MMFNKKKDVEDVLGSEQLPTEPNVAEDNLIRNSETVHLKPSIISEGFEFIGEIRSKGSITVDGKLKGTISVQSLTIGSTGSVDGNVTADNINVKGELSGQMECRDLVIGGRAVVEGSLTYSNLAIQRGGIIKGDLKRK
jgi:cytoskeletal protein CcmA (bactofilin family)